MANVAVHHSERLAGLTTGQTVPIGAWGGQELGIGHKRFMVETTAIDGFLGGALRAIRAGQAAGWPDVGPDADWSGSSALTAIWSRIEYHGIPLLLHQSADLLEQWPDPMRDRIAEEARLIGLWETTHVTALTKLLAAPDAAGIETVLMKGTAIAYALYDEPAARRRGDSDLLIRPADLARARAVFAACGWYRNDDPHGLTHQEGWLCDAAGHFVHALDLHWQPSDRPVLQRVLAAQDLFAHKQPLPRLSPHAFGADAAITLIHETINQKWHEAYGYWAEQGRVKGGRRLIWSVDFDLLVRTMADADWTRLVTLCAERGVGPLVAGALHGAARDLATPLPAPVRGTLDALEAMPVDRDVAAYFATSDALGEFLLDLRTAHSWGDRIAMVRDRAFPPRAHLVEKYPQAAGWPTLALQLRLLGATAGRIVRKVARG